MRFFVDHNLSPQLIPTVSSIYHDHEFQCARDEGLMAEDDIPLFAKFVERQWSAPARGEYAQVGWTLGAMCVVHPALCSCDLSEQRFLRCAKRLSGSTASGGQKSA